MIDEMRSSFGMPLRLAMHSDTGRVRTNNEDSHGHAWLPDGSLFVVVADGMGGHEAGEVASGLAVQVLEEVVSRDAVSDPRERLYHGLLEANEAILQEGRASGTRGMGTTTVAAILKGPEVHIGLVGDSRLYHIRRGHLIWRTLDHTRVQMLVDHGEIPEDDARHHPDAGMLTRALGHSRMADGRPLVPDVLAEPLHIEGADALVMCSDGLHDLLEDWEIGQVVAGREPLDAAQELVRLACERGGHDNVTVAVVVAGDRAGEYDADWSPPSWEPSEVQVEQTYDEIPLGEITAAAEAAPSAGGRSKTPLMLGIAAMGGFAVVAVVLAAIALVIALVFWAWST
ncbi:MAG: serine/threonine-protein phosphatase [Alphaproteobacteria bacterium]|nr:serine/threonine-protein phosphatase [Alphaproteobacteria bacterium]